MKTRFYRDVNRPTALTHIVLKDVDSKQFIACKPDFPLCWQETSKVATGKMCTKCEKQLKRIKGE